MGIVQYILFEIPDTTYQKDYEKCITILISLLTLTRDWRDDIAI